METTIKHLGEGVIRVPDETTSDEIWQFLRSGGRVTVQPTIRRSVGVDALLDRFIAHREQVRPASAATEKKHSRRLKNIFKTIFKRMPKATASAHQTSFPVRTSARKSAFQPAICILPRMLSFSG
ncbi:MAG: hypothetical protein EXR98_23355 [Gemmataceae bacterium]|nr:hypothetical protein [Gemmataceae bacterium]